MFCIPFQRTPATRHVPRSQPRLEGLEDRVAPATFNVNTLLDTVAVNAKSSTDASGHISVRSAIMAANAKPNADTIKLPNGIFALTLAA
jgi:hypothetical protein